MGAMKAWVRELAACDARAGNKAANLGSLVGANLPVPPGFAILTEAFRALVGKLPSDDIDQVGHALATAAERIESAELPSAFVAEVAERLDALGPRLVVRSSSTLEDSQTGAAPGVFASVIDVAPTELWPAIRTVWASAMTPIAASYAEGRTPLALGVIVQQFVPGQRVVVYTRPPGHPARDEMWVQRGESVEKRGRSASDDIARLALAAERALRADGGADVELVVGHDRTWVVQARPIVHPVVTPRMEAPPMLLAALVADARVWTLDVTHNPDPLSTAQTGLVERVEAAGFAPWSMRVCGGYLYTAERVPLPRVDIHDAAELRERASVLEARLQTVLDDAPVDDLAAALTQYLAFYQIWATELVPLVVAGKARLSGNNLIGARPSAVEATLLAAARGELEIAAVRARLGHLAPAWDVAVPTYDEAPTLVVEAIARLQLAASAAVEREPAAASEIAHVAADLAERDDFLFAAAQWRIRRALLARADALGWERDDIFWIPLDEALEGTLDPVTVRRRAAAGRGAAERAAQWTMPIVVGGPARAPSPPLHGLGTGGRTRGHVCKIAATRAATTRIVRGHVVVVRAITPGMAVLVAGAGAIVSESGGPLDHGAAMARELGIPCIVGCHEAWSRLGDGQLVTVDADVGVVTPDDHSSSR